MRDNFWEVWPLLLITSPLALLRPLQYFSPPHSLSLVWKWVITSGVGWPPLSHLCTPPGPLLSLSPFLCHPIPCLLVSVFIHLHLSRCGLICRERFFFLSLTHIRTHAKPDLVVPQAQGKEQGAFVTWVREVVAKKGPLLYVCEWVCVPACVFWGLTRERKGVRKRNRTFSFVLFCVLLCGSEEEHNKKGRTQIICLPSSFRRVLDPPPCSLTYL